MILRRIGLGAVCLAVASQAILVPSSVTLPDLTVESLNRHGADPQKPHHDDTLQALPISTEDFLEKWRHLQLGVSEEMAAQQPPTDREQEGEDDDDDDDDYDFDYDIDEDGGNVGWTVVSIPDDIWEKWEARPAVDNDENDDDEDEEEEGDFEDDLFPNSGYFNAHDYVEYGRLVPEAVEAKHWTAVIDDDKIANECPKDSSFEAILCRIRSMVTSKFDQVKPYFSHHRRPCPKKLAAMAKAKAEGLPHPPTSGGIAKFWPYFHPGEKMPDSHEAHQHYHHHHHGKFGHVLGMICKGLRTFVTGFLIPVLIGVAAGMTASLVGMCVGTVLAWCWIKFVRGGKRGNASGRVVDEADVVNGEKEGLLELEAESVEAPPVYIERE